MPALRAGQGLGKRKRATIQVKIILTWVINKNTKTNDRVEVVCLGKCAHICAITQNQAMVWKSEPSNEFTEVNSFAR